MPYNQAATVSRLGPREDILLMLVTERKGGKGKTVLILN